MYIYIPVDMHAWVLAECLIEELECYNIGDLINVRSDHDLPSHIYADIRSSTIYMYISILYLFVVIQAVQKSSC